MDKSKYLHGRPFLIIKHLRIKGPSRDEPWHTHEQPLIADHISNRLMCDAAVIIDVLNAKLVKNRFQDTPEDQVVAHYLDRYREQTKQGVSLWMEKRKLAIQRQLLEQPQNLTVDAAGNLSILGTTVPE